MKIVSRKQLMALPAGTVFSYYEPCVFRGLYIKNSEPEEGAVDFVISDLIGAVDNNSTGDFLDKCGEMELGKSLPVDFNQSGREGLFDDKQLFSVYEKEDVQKLIEELQESLT